MITFRSPFILFAIGAAFVALATACTKKCDTPDVDSLNAIYLQFETNGGENAFTPEELDSVFIVRFSALQEFDTFNVAIDTINIFLQEGFANDYKIRLSKDIPQAATTGPPYYTDFKYLFKSYGQPFEVRLQNITLTGQYVGDEECDYVNLEKTFFLNSDSIDATGSTAYVPITKN